MTFWPTRCIIQFFSGESKDYKYNFSFHRLLFEFKYPAKNDKHYRSQRESRKTVQVIKIPPHACSEQQMGQFL